MSAQQPAIVWSYSDSQLFKSCQRKWYFAKRVASHSSKNRIRYEAFIMSKLQHLEEWRGSLVDRVIEEKIVIPLNSTGRMNPYEALQYARELFDAQMEFSKAHEYRNGETIEAAGNKYAALYAHDNGFVYSDEELEQARLDVETALNNLFENDLIMSLLHEATYLVAQRPLFLYMEEIAIKAIPDLMLFFNDQPPTIIDWKVHTTGKHDYWLQLACYAVTLMNGEPHKDFRPYLTNYSPTDLQLYEVQLLVNNLRPYRLDQEAVDNVLDYMYENAKELTFAIDGQKRKDLNPSPFDRTNNPENCSQCPFFKMCWAGEQIW